MCYCCCCCTSVHEEWSTHESNTTMSAEKSANVERNAAEQCAAFHSSTPLWQQFSHSLRLCPAHSSNLHRNWSGFSKSDSTEGAPEQLKGATCSEQEGAGKERRGTGLHDDLIQVEYTLEIIVKADSSGAGSAWEQPPMKEEPVGWSRSEGAIEGGAIPLGSVGYCTGPRSHVSCPAALIFLHVGGGVYRGRTG